MNLSTHSDGWLIDLPLTKKRRLHKLYTIKHWSQFFFSHILSSSYTFINHHLWNILYIRLHSVVLRYTFNSISLSTHTQIFICEQYNNNKPTQKMTINKDRRDSNPTNNTETRVRIMYYIYIYIRKTRDSGRDRNSTTKRQRTT